MPHGNPDGFRAARQSSGFGPCRRPPANNPANNRPDSWVRRPASRAFPHGFTLLVMGFPSYPHARPEETCCQTDTPTGCTCCSHTLLRAFLFSGKSQLIGPHEVGDRQRATPQRPSSRSECRRLTDHPPHPVQCPPQGAGWKTPSHGHRPRHHHHLRRSRQHPGRRRRNPPRKEDLRHRPRTRRGRGRHRGRREISRIGPLRSLLLQDQRPVGR